MSGTVLRLSRTHHPVTVLGHGTRAGIWTQGCGIGCSGCIARDTWAPDGGSQVRVEALLGWLSGLPGPLDGLTVSGGEPLEQPEALAVLLAGVRERFTAPGFDLLLYSGRAWPALARDRRAAPALQLCDAVVAGPYVRRRAAAHPLRGSGNQRIVPLTALGRTRYGDLDGAAPQAEPALQISISGGRLHLVGIPRPGDMERLTERLAEAGIACGEETWRA